MSIQIEKNMLLDVFDIYGRDKTTGKYIFQQENLTSSAINGTADTTEVRNGRGNSLFATLNTNKSITVEVASNVFSFEQIAMLAGTTVTDDVNGVTYAPAQKITCQTTGQIELEIEPKNADEVEIFKDGKPVVATVSEKIATITGAQVGDVYKVLPYKVDFVAGDYSVIDIKADEFPEAIELIIKGVERDANSKVVAELTFVFDRCKPSNDFSLSTASSGEPSENTITFNALNSDGSLAKIYRKAVAK